MAGHTRSKRGLTPAAALLWLTLWAHVSSPSRRPDRSFATLVRSVALLPSQDRRPAIVLSAGGVFSGRALLVGSPMPSQRLAERRGRGVIPRVVVMP